MAISAFLFAYVVKKQYLCGMKGVKSEETVVSLSELCSEIGSCLRSGLSGRRRVHAEISSLSVRAGGHCYLELVESEGSDEASKAFSSGREPIAKVRATCWRNVWAGLSAYFAEVTGEPLQAGMHVLLEVTVDFHPVYSLSLQVLDIDPAYTLGDMLRVRRETIARLQANGMMDLQPALRLPTLARRIAVVSAAGAAGYQDFTDQLQRSGYAFLTRLFPAVMQGEQCPPSVIRALDDIYAEDGRWDAVVIIRGGGAVTDLSCFDDYALSEYCAQFPLPIISGIGHTRDVSVLDMVCHAAVKTPTAAAEWFVARMDAQTERLQRLQSMLRPLLMQGVLRERHRLELLEKTIALHSPERIYRQGYSLMTKNGCPVRSVAELEAGDEVKTSFADGEAITVVKQLLRT